MSRTEDMRYPRVGPRARTREFRRRVNKRYSRGGIFTDATFSNDNSSQQIEPVLPATADDINQRMRKQAHRYWQLLAKGEASKEWTAWARKHNDLVSRAALSSARNRS